MALPQIVARNTIQGIPTTELNTRLVGATLIFYTCPTGKKALIKGQSVCTGLGAATNVRLEADGIAVLRWDNSAVEALQIDISKPFEIQLAAGETLAKAQNSGTNGEVNVNASILETPA